MLKKMQAVELNAVSIRDNLTSTDDRQYQFPIHYAYDYLRGGIKSLRPSLKLNDYLQSQTFLKLSASKEGRRGEIIERGNHGISLSPLKAGLPWASGILLCRQSKHWRLSLDTTSAFLKMFAIEDSAGVISKLGNSIAEISRRILSSNNLEEEWAKFPSYLFTEGDEQRTKLLAITMVFIFVLDDFWEAHGISSFRRIQDVFLERMQSGKKIIDGPKSTLQDSVDNMITEILDLDQKNGNNSGKEMIEVMVRFFNRPPPPKKYKSMEDYLLYRHEDVAALYVLTCIKFSLNSSVDVDSPSLAKYIRLFKDHLSIANDIGSWEKEKHAYDAGKCEYLINAVGVTKELFGLATFDAAVAMTQAFQYRIECDIDKEVQRLVDEDVLTGEEWRFVDATLYALSGNVLVSIISSRYGGETYRLRR